MFCWKCGKEVSPDSKFCEYCGSVLNHGQVENVAAIPPKKRKRKKVIISVIAAVLVVAIGVGGFLKSKRSLRVQPKMKEQYLLLKIKASLHLRSWSLHLLLPCKP